MWGLLKVRDLRRKWCVAYAENLVLTVRHLLTETFPRAAIWMSNYLSCISDLFFQCHVYLNQLLMLFDTMILSCLVMDRSCHGQLISWPATKFAQIYQNYILMLLALPCLHQFDYLQQHPLTSCQIAKNEKPRKRPRDPPNSATREVKG